MKPDKEKKIKKIKRADMNNFFMQSTKRVNE